MSFCVQRFQLLRKPKNQISFHRHFKGVFDEILVVGIRSASYPTHPEYVLVDSAVRTC